MPEADPLLLLPMRLEYRYFAPMPDPAERTIRPETAALWFRWYPDGVLGHESPPAISPDEQGALDRFRGALDPSARWFDVTNPRISEAWQAFAGEVGFHRALHLQRTGGPPPARANGAAILGLAERVELHAIRGGALERLATGEPIPASLSYGPDALAPGAWLTDFDAAVRNGMGVRLTGESVLRALEAEWIVAVGLQRSDGTEELTRYFEDAVAAGDLAFVPQDAPTNGSPRERSAYHPRPRDLVAALAESTYTERRPPGSPTSDADLLATALGIPADVVCGAPHAGSSDRHAAVSMTMALVPGLTRAFENVLRQEGVEPGALERILVEHATARGPLPVVRLDDSPYGILPISLPGVFAPPADASNETRAALEFVNRFSSASIAALGRLAGDVPVIRPGAAGQGGTLRKLLGELPVSPHVGVAETPRSGVALPAACPLVGDDATGKAGYLRAMLTTSMPDLYDPTKEDRTTPLLYRLLRLSVAAFVEDLPEPDRRLSATAAAATPGTAGATALRLSAWTEAVMALSGRSRPELEVLMMEVLDLLDHRLDAWQTALASHRLARLRTTRRHGIRLGSYGFLSRLRTESATAATDGYVQAPSLAHATTAALLRSAALRHDAADAHPFRVVLSSRRVRSARRILDVLRRGLSLSEALGYHAERWLHDRRHDAVIHDLRRTHAIQRAPGEGGPAYPLVDGRGLLNDPTVDARGPVYQLVRAEIGEQLDALSDVVVAEAVHALALGDLSTAAAWMEVLAGGGIPGALRFARTNRAGHGASWRVIVFGEPPAPGGTNLRSIAEPLLSSMTTSALAGFDDAAVRARISGPRGVVVLEPSLARDLGMDPIDLVAGGEAEVVTRARAWALAGWERHAAARLGPLPDEDLAGFLSRTRPLDLDLTFSRGGAPTVRDLLAAAQPLVRLAGAARSLVPADLNAAATEDSRGLGASAEAEVYRAGVTALRRRAEVASATLGALLRTVERARTDVFRMVRDILQRDVKPQTRRYRAPEMAALDERKRALDDAMLALLRAGAPAAPTPSTALEVLRAPESYRALTDRVVAHTQGAIATLRSAIDVSDPSSPGTAVDARALAERLATALRDASGQALPVWAPFEVTDRTRPAVDEETTTAAEALGPWPRVRPALAAALAFASRVPDVRARVTRGRLPENRRPDLATAYHGIHLSRGEEIPVRLAAGLVVDEWNDVQPRPKEVTGIAVNHDSPKHQPPHVLLLGVPPCDDMTEWPAEAVPALVQEAIRLMRFRALPSRSASLRNLGFCALNLVPSRGPVQRLPVQEPPARAGENEAFAWRIADVVPRREDTVHALHERDLTRR